MSYNGSGVFEINSSGQPVSANTLIEASKFNALTADLASGLSNAICKDGQTTITANLPMATYRHTGVGNGAARTDYAAMGQVQDGKINWVDGGGTADAITATYSPALTALVDGQLCFVRATAANATTTPTFAPNGLTAKTIVRNGGVALVAGNIVGDGHELILRYDLANTRWELLNPAPVDFQPLDAELTALAGLTSAANKVPMFSGSGTATLLDFKDEDNMASDSATAVPSQQSVKAYVDSTVVLPIFTEGFQSTEQDITATGTFSVPHGLSSAPLFVQCVLKCIDAGGDAGFSQNDMVFTSPSHSTFNGAGAAEDGYVVWFDSTNVSVRFGVYLVGINKTTGAIGGLTMTKWKMIVRAYA